MLWTIWPLAQSLWWFHWYVNIMISSTTGNMFLWYKQEFLPRDTTLQSNKIDILLALQLLYKDIIETGVKDTFLNTGCFNTHVMNINYLKTLYLRSRESQWHSCRNTLYFLFLWRLFYSPDVWLCLTLSSHYLHSISGAGNDHT